MIDVIGWHREIACGSANIAGGVVAEWELRGFGLVEAVGLLDATSLYAARLLVDAELTLAQIGREIERHGQRMTVGYAFANGDITMDEVLALPD